jgi:hypothetical protein
MMHRCCQTCAAAAAAAAAAETLLPSLPDSCTCFGPASLCAGLAPGLFSQQLQAHCA